MWFPHAFIGVMEQLQHAVKTGAPPALSVDDNVKTMALVEAGYRSIGREAHRQALRNLNQTDHQGGNAIMMQAGIFTGYFPYGLEETAKKIRALGFNTVQLDLHFKDVDLGAGQITKDKAKKVRDTFRDHNLPICCVSGYTNIIHPDLGERKANVGYLKEIIRNARDFGTPLCDLRDRHLQHRIRLGAAPQEQDGGRLRNLPQGDRGARADRL